MSAVGCTIVIDTSVLSKRPEPLDIKEFLDKKLRIDWSKVKCIQLHNLKNVVWLGVNDEAEAKRLVSLHHLVHCFSCAGKEIPIRIPVYEKSRAVDVRIHDLDEEIGDEVVVDYLRQFGEVISIRPEAWRNFFPGLLNGVRVARMVINRHIPSYATFNDQDTLITYKGQVRCCKGCGGKPHPKLRCHEAAANNKTTTESSSNADLEKHFPALPTKESKQIKQQSSKPQRSTSTPEPPPPPSISNSQQQGNNKEQIKRQRSTETATSSNKKTNTKGAESGYNAYLDPHVHLAEMMKTDFCDSIKDPEERKKTLMEYAERVCALRRRDLEEAKKQQKK